MGWSQFRLNGEFSSIFPKQVRCQLNSILGLAGGSRGFNRVPRALLVIMDWSMAQNKLPGPSFKHFGTKSCQFDVNSMLF